MMKRYFDGVYKINVNFHVTSYRAQGRYNPKNSYGFKSYIYLSCLIGSSIVSVPVVLVFRQVIDYLRNRKYFSIVIRWLDAKIESRAKKLKATSILGLIVFVGDHFQLQNHGVGLIWYLFLK